MSNGVWGAVVGCGRSEQGSETTGGQVVAGLDRVSARGKAGAEDQVLLARLAGNGRDGKLKLRERIGRICAGDVLEQIVLAIAIRIGGPRGLLDCSPEKLHLAGDLAGV